MKILIAEDDPVASRILRLTIEHAGHEVIVVSNGAAAWERYLKEPVGAVVSDWMMPEIDGLELCRRIRARMEAGIDDFLTKPLDREAVWMRLRVAERILGFTRQIRQLGELLPICAYCKKIREDGSYWQQFEEYIQEHTGAHFSHGVCPECFEKQMHELDEKKAQKESRPALTMAAIEE